MKTSIFFLFVIFLLLGANQALATEIFVDCYQIPTELPEFIVIESSCGDEELNAQIERIPASADITDVIYVCSTYSEEGYDQKELDEKRWDGLLALMPQLATDEYEKTTIRQQACETAACARKLLHGFIIAYTYDSPFNTSLLTRQSYTFNVQNGFKLEGENELILDFPPDAFVDADGNTVSGEVQMLFRDAMQLENIVKGGLSTLTADDEVLISGGMFEVQAFQNGRELSLAEEKEIRVTAGEELHADMLLYRGEREGETLAWTDPVGQDSSRQNQIQLQAIEVMSGWREIFWDRGLSKRPFLNSIRWSGGDCGDVTLTLRSKKVNIKSATYTAETGLALGLELNQAEALVKIFDWGCDAMLDSVALLLHPERGTGVWGDQRVGDGMMQDNFPTMEQNMEMISSFGMKNLGWANIDRLARFRNSRPVELAVRLPENIIEDQRVTISLVVPELNIFIPGYRRKDGLYAFTHGDFEREAPMPLGMKADIICVTGEGETAHFGRKKITLGKNTVERMSLLPRDIQAALNEVEFAF